MERHLLEKINTMLGSSDKEMVILGMELFWNNTPTFEDAIYCFDLEDVMSNTKPNPERFLYIASNFANDDAETRSRLLLAQAQYIVNKRWRHFMNVLNDSESNL